MKRAAKNEADALKSSTAYTVDSLKNYIGNNISNAEKEVGEQIKTEFDKENIRNLIREETIA
jgi:hypothetical protein